MISPTRNSLTFIFLLVFCELSFAKVIKDFPPAKFMGFISNFSGDEGNSFSKTKTSYGIGVSVQTDGKTLSPIMGVKVFQASGNQNFLDGSIKVNSNYMYYGASTELGVIFFPIERQKHGLNIYVSGGGVIGYNYAELQDELNLKNIPRSDQSFSAGYFAGVGSEWVFTASRTEKWSINSEVIFKKEKATLFKSAFYINSIAFCLGFGW